MRIIQIENTVLNKIEEDRRLPRGKNGHLLNLNRVPVWKDQYLYPYYIQRVQVLLLRVLFTDEECFT